MKWFLAFFILFGAFSVEADSRKVTVELERTTAIDSQKETRALLDEFDGTVEVVLSSWKPLALSLPAKAQVEEFQSIGFLSRVGFAVSGVSFVDDVGLSLVWKGEVGLTKLSRQGRLRTVLTDREESQDVWLIHPAVGLEARFDFLNFDLGAFELQPFINPSLGTILGAMKKTFFSQGTLFSSIVGAGRAGLLFRLSGLRSEALGVPEVKVGPYQTVELLGDYHMNAMGWEASFGLAF